MKELNVLLVVILDSVSSQEILIILINFLP